MARSTVSDSTTLSPRRTLTVFLSTIALAGVLLSPALRADADEPDCDVPAGTLAPLDIPEDTSVIECELVGRTVVNEDGQGLTIPEPGMAVGSESLEADGDMPMFQIEVSVDGVVSFPAETQDTEDLSSTVSAAAASPDACVDQSYKTNDLKEYDIYNWYIGDGAMPAGLTRPEAREAFKDAINNITGSSNNCSWSDQVSAQSEYQGGTTYEADMNSSGTCTDRDGQSTWDAGNLDSGTVGKTCWWSWPIPGAKNDLREADVRFNTTDYDFVNTTTNCPSGRYDLRSVATHEAGHVFGMGHVGTGHSELTMYTNSFTCTAKARSLGTGDVFGLRSIY